MKRVRLSMGMSNLGTHFTGPNVPGIGQLSSEPVEVDFDADIFREAAAAFSINQGIQVEILGDELADVPANKALEQARKQLGEAEAALSKAQERTADLQARLVEAEASASAAESAFGEENGSWDDVVSNRLEVEKARLKFEGNKSHLAKYQAAVQAAQEVASDLEVEAIGKHIAKDDSLGVAFSRYATLFEELRAAADALMSAAQATHDQCWALAAAQCRAGQEHSYSFKTDGPKDILKRAAVLQLTGDQKATLARLYPSLGITWDGVGGADHSFPSVT